jgi:hypothetical protein
MSNRSLQRRQIPLWKVAPFLLVPPTLVAAISLYWNLELTPFVTTLGLTCLTMLLLLVRRSNRDLAAHQADSQVSYRKHPKK